MATIVLTAIGDDRTGLVTAMSELIAEHGGNWERSQLAELAGKFAGIVMVTVPDQRADELVAALGGLRERGLLDVRAERATGEPTPAPRTPIVIEIAGNDRPGIVRDVSRALSACGVSIDELQTATREAPMAGGTLFEARATLQLPPGVDVDAVTVALERITDELMVDIIAPEPA